VRPGVYTARAVEWDFGVTSNGNEQVAVVFQNTEGERITWYGYFSDKAALRTLESLRHAGWDGRQETFADLAGLGSRDVELVVEEEEYNGQVRARVRWVNEPGRGGPALKETMSTAQRQAFASRMRGAIGVAAQQYGGQAPPSPRQAPAPAPRRVPPATRQAPPAHGGRTYAQAAGEPEDDIPY